MTVTPGVTSSVIGICWTRDSRSFYAATLSGVIIHWNIVKNDLICKYECHDYNLTCLTSLLEVENDIIFVGTSSGDILGFNSVLDNQNYLFKLENVDSITSLTFMKPFPDIFLSSDVSGSLKVWNFKLKILVSEFQYQKSICNIDSAGSEVMINCFDGTLMYLKLINLSDVYSIELIRQVWT